MRDKKKILIVDDAEINRSLLSDMLSDEYDIIEAENGMIAAAILHKREHEISLMLLDIVMPVMDGFEMLAIMNKNGWIKSIPVVMISAETVPAYVDRAYDLGVLDYISRPFDERTVRRRVISTIMLAEKQKELSNMVTNQIYENVKDNKLMIEILSNIVEFRNGESGLHVLHVQTLTELMLNKLLEKTKKYQISQRDIFLICNAAALHDVGKIAIPEEILNKPGRLTKEEFEIMKTHSAEGAKLISHIPMRQNEPLIKYSYQITRWHHERYDGRGYPDALKGEEIPIAAQVVSIADVYDALTSQRVYKQAYSHEKAMQMILNGECGVFNPLLIECLKELSTTLKKALNTISLEQNTEREMLHTVENLIEKGDMDVSERTIRLLERERMKYKFFADMSKEIQFEYTEVPEMIMLSQWGSEYLGVPETILNPNNKGFEHKIFKDCDLKQFLDKLKCTTPDNPVIEDIYLVNVKGTERWCRVTARSMWSNDEPPEYAGAIGKIVDIHEDLEKMRKLELAVAQDSVTGLLNHAAARNLISSALANENADYAMILIDVDGFKSVNHRLGFHFGDELLKYIADKIKSTISGADVAGRVGGDQFLVFTDDNGNVKTCVEKLFNSLVCNFNGFDIKVSIGVSFTKSGKRSYDALFGMADEALCSVNKKGGNSYCFYDEGIQD
jgi:putative two-component system response regulator